LALALVTFGARWLKRLSFPLYATLIVAGLLLLGLELYEHLTSNSGRLVFRERNFYGALSVSKQWDKDMLRTNFTLMHGRIVHGIQSQQDRKLATTYYDVKSGVGLALS